MDPGKLPSRTASTSAHQRSKSPPPGDSTAPEAPATGPTALEVGLRNVRREALRMVSDHTTTGVVPSFGKLELAIRTLMLAGLEESVDACQEGFLGYYEIRKRYGRLEL